MIKRVNKEKIERRQRKVARRHIQKYAWRLAEIRSGTSSKLTTKDKWILRKAIKSERLLSRMPHKNKVVG